MIRLSELGPRVEKVKRELEGLVSSMLSYKKIKTDLRASAFIHEVKDKIKKIDLAYSTFTRKDLAHLYGNYDFTDWVRQIEGWVEDFKATYKKIKAFESITDYR